MSFERGVWLNLTSHEILFHIVYNDELLMHAEAGTRTNHTITIQKSSYEGITVFC